MTEKQKELIYSCNKNAEDFIKAAKVTFNSNLPNIAFHLSVLAIEEIGKACLIRSSTIASRTGGWLQKRFDDHCEKLYWAFIVPELLKGKINENDFINAKQLAHDFHSKRIKAIYISHEDTLYQVSEEEANDVIKLAEARLEIEKKYSEISISDKHEKLLQWFVSINGDEEKKSKVNSKEFLDKLAQLNNDIVMWVEWIQEEFEKNEQELQKLLKQELNRTPPAGQETYKPKWQFKVRLHAISHSVKPKNLKWWNDQSNVIKLSCAEGKRRSKQLIVTFSLPKSVHINNLWTMGLWPTNLFILALNIGSQGLFGWYSLGNQNNIYEEVLDLENKKHLKIVPSLSTLAMDWGHRNLEQKDLENIGLCLYFLSKLNTNCEEKAFFEAYLKGLAFLTKTDIHLILTPNACDLFFYTLRSGMKFYGDWDESVTFSVAFKKYFNGFAIQDDFFEEIITLNDRFLSGSKEKQDFTDLSYERTMQVKALTDIYFLRTFQKLAKTEIPDVSKFT